MYGTHAADCQKAGRVRPWPGRIRSAGGSRTHLKLLCRQPPCRLAPAPSNQVSSPGVEPGLRPSRGRVQIPHTPRTCLRSVPCRGIEPRPAVSRTAMRSSTPAGQHRKVARPGIEPGLTASEAGVRSGTLTGHIFSIPTRSRTWTRALGVPCAIRYTIGTINHTRADDWICTSMMRFTGPLPRFSATSAISRSARSRTPLGGIGGRFLSQEDTPVIASDPEGPEALA